MVLRMVVAPYLHTPTLFGSEHDCRAWNGQAESSEAVGLFIDPNLISCGLRARFEETPALPLKPCLRPNPEQEIGKPEQFANFPALSC